MSEAHIRQWRHQRFPLLPGSRPLGCDITRQECEECRAPGRSLPSLMVFRGPQRWLNGEQRRSPYIFMSPFLSGGWNESLGPSICISYIFTMSTLQVRFALTRPSIKLRIGVVPLSSQYVFIHTKSSFVNYLTFTHKKTIFKYFCCLWMHYWKMQKIWIITNRQKLWLGICFIHL